MNIIRNYKESDYEDCIKLVNKVWKFDKHFNPPALSQLFQRIYTGGPLSESNFLNVVEEDGQLKGFLFGKIENQELTKDKYSNFAGQLKILKRLFSIKGVTFKKKLGYLKKVKLHEINRQKVEPRESSEVNLFVVDPESQGQGWGRKLINEFIAACKTMNVNRIVLETDKESNYGFYEHLCFRIKGSFYSPIQKEYSGVSGDTYVYELYL